MAAPVWAAMPWLSGPMMNDPLWGSVVPRADTISTSGHPGDPEPAAPAGAHPVIAANASAPTAITARPRHAVRPDIVPLHWTASRPAPGVSLAPPS
jgi:hypothetical protein